MKQKFYTMLMLALLAGLPVNNTAAQNATNMDETYVDEVIVTTTRSETSRLDNSGSIATLDPFQTLSLFPVDLLNKAPGVHIHRGSGQEHLTAIRSPVLVGGAGAGSFLYLEDGISLRAPAFANVNALIDAMPSAAQRVEIVRGPGSALYGSNAVHGLVNFISGPIYKDKTKSRISAGSYGRYTLESQWSQQHENFASRIFISQSGDKEGYRANSGFTQQKTRLETSWQNRATGYHLSFAGMNLDQETAGYIKTAAGAKREAYEDRTLAKSNPSPDAYRDARSWRTALRMKRTLEDGAQLSITPYLRSNEMQFRMHFLPGTASTSVEENAHSSLGAQIAYQRDTPWMSYTTGLDVDLTQGSLTEKQSGADKLAFGANSLDYAQGTHYDFDVDARVLAPFIHAVWPLGSKTELTTGLRGELTDYDYTNNTRDGRQGKLFRPASRSDDFSDISPKLGLVYALSDNLSGNPSGNRRIFVNLARAARVPQVNDLYRLRDKDKDGAVPEINQIDSETLDSLEFGYRATYPQGQYELTTFVMRKKNYHFRDGNDYYEINGKTNHHGMELDLSWMPMQNLSLQSSLSHAVHEYAFNRNVTGGNSLESIKNGNQMDSAPKTLGTTTATISANERLSTALVWNHVGAYYMDASNTAKYGGHNIFDAKVTLFSQQPGATIEISIYNLMDKNYARRADKWFGDNRYFPGEGRRFMISASRRN